jgi:hypothetical protein
MKGGRKYIGEIILDRDIDNLSGRMKEKLKTDIYKKMYGNEWFIKNIEIREPGHWSLLNGPNDGNFIKMKGSRVRVIFYGRSQLTGRGQLIWVRRNFKRSINFNKKMFLDDSLKAIKVSVIAVNKLKK